MRVVESLMSTTNYQIVPEEEEVRETALLVALETGSSGFDAYIIALDLKRNAPLITDDESMARNAARLGVHAPLLR